MNTFIQFESRHSDYFLIHACQYNFLSKVFFYTYTATWLIIFSKVKLYKIKI